MIWLEQSPTNSSWLQRRYTTNHKGKVIEEKYTMVVDFKGDYSHADFAHELAHYKLGHLLSEKNFNIVKTKEKDGNEVNRQCSYEHEEDAWNMASMWCGSIGNWQEGEEAHKNRCLETYSKHKKPTLRRKVIKFIWG